MTRIGTRPKPGVTSPSSHRAGGTSHVRPLPAPGIQPCSARLCHQAARSSGCADPVPHFGKPLSRRADCTRPQRQARPVPQLRQCEDRRRHGRRHQRDPVPAVQPDQGADILGGLDAGRGRQAVVHGQGRRPPAGVRFPRQRRHHPAAGDDPPGRLSERRCDAGNLDRPRPDASAGLRLLVGMDPGHPPAVPRPGRRIWCRRW